jgi:hypothetical protein
MRQHGAQRPWIGDEGDAKLARERRRPARVIVVLVREEDRAEARRLRSRLAQAAHERPAVESGIYEHGCATRLHEERVSRTATAQ